MTFEELGSHISLLPPHKRALPVKVVQPDFEAIFYEVAFENDPESDEGPVLVI